ncbi:MAG TPA: hypothetical protein DEA43_04725 [Candidatus Moranbacteria bacterium]|nr:hypothetical protein [Candidatus Moranbacteria bacterium]HBT46158.1 hypothetical protein [Candidatus Moranbacteria bacterium]
MFTRSTLQCENIFFLANSWRQRLFELLDTRPVKLFTAVNTSLAGFDGVNIHPKACQKEDIFTLQKTATAFIKYNEFKSNCFRFN